jgi:SOS-response transcriptional repressor LexA
LTVGVTPQGSRIVEFVRAFREDNGYGPSFTEIAAGTGLKSVSSVHHHLRILVHQGRIAYRPNLPRTIHVVGDD